MPVITHNSLNAAAPSMIEDDGKKDDLKISSAEIKTFVVSTDATPVTNGDLLGDLNLGSTSDYSADLLGGGGGAPAAPAQQQQHSNSNILDIFGDSSSLPSSNAGVADLDFGIPAPK